MRDPKRDDIDYLHDILERLQRIRNFAQEGEAIFLDSLIIQDAVIRNFEVIGEATKRLTMEIRQKYPQVIWKQMAGFRDILIHNYSQVRLDAVWIAIETDIPKIESQILEILQELKNEA